MNQNIIIGVIVAIIIYFIYIFWFYKSSVLLESTSLKINNTNIDMAKAIEPTSYRYTYSMWVYVNTWDNSKIKPIVHRSTSITDPLTQFKLYLDSVTATLKLKILLESERSNSSLKIDDVIITDSFPIQKWTHVTVSVDSQYCDMYIDGKLTKSIKYSSTPIQPAGVLVPLNVGKHLVGYVETQVSTDIFMSKLKLTPNTQSPQEVWSEYLKGNTDSWFSFLSSYGATLSVTKDSIEKVKMSIF
jgi:hypothetical protein